MFSRQKMAAYLVTWSLDIKSNITNELLDLGNLHGDIYLYCLCKLNVNYSISCFPSKKWWHIWSCGR